MPGHLAVIGLLFLLGFRIALNAADSNVVDIGYAGVIGADRIMDGDDIYGKGFNQDVGNGDTYGPVNYLAYVPFEQAIPWSGEWDGLPAAHGAAGAFDLAVLLGLLLLGFRLRPGPAARSSGWRSRSPGRRIPLRLRPGVERKRFAGGGHGGLGPGVHRLTGRQGRVRRSGGRHQVRSAGPGPAVRARSDGGGAPTRPLELAGPAGS